MSNIIVWMQMSAWHNFQATHRVCWIEMLQLASGLFECVLFSRLRCKEVDPLSFFITHSFANSCGIRICQKADNNVAGRRQWKIPWNLCIFQEFQQFYWVSAPITSFQCCRIVIGLCVFHDFAVLRQYSIDWRKDMTFNNAGNRKCAKTKKLSLGLFLASARCINMTTENLISLPRDRIPKFNAHMIYSYNRFIGI